MDEVVSSNGRAVPVTHDVDDGQLGLGQLDPRREAQGAAVGRVDRTGVDIPRHTARTSDARRDDRFGLLLVQRHEGPEQRVHNDAMSAPGAPDMGKEPGSKPTYNFLIRHNYATSSITLYI